MSSDAAIQLTNLSKAYTIYNEPSDRLKQAVVPRLLKLARPLVHAFGGDLAERSYFRSYEALRPLSLEIRLGETVGVIGQNGSGKSTLLKLICGTLEPTTGDVTTRGRIGALLELGSGFNPEYTGRENVMLNASVLGLSQEQTLERLDDILAFADIGEFIDQPIKTYSSGMAMRLAFAVIAHIDADILVIDEALAVGDAYFQQKCMRWLRQFREHGTVLFCGHDTSAVLNLCQRAVWLDKGSMRMIGSGKEVGEAYLAYVAAKAAGLPDEVVNFRYRGAATMSDATDLAPDDDAQDQSPELPEPPVPDKPVVFDWTSQSYEHGTGEVEINKVELTLADGNPLYFIKGGENVRVKVHSTANRNLQSLIFGFFVKDRLGVPILGDNTFLKYIADPLDCIQGDKIVANFTFVLPHLMTGRYSITAAVASGTTDTYIMHHWLHDSLFFDVISRYRNGVLIAHPSMQMNVTGLKPDSVSDSSR